MSVKGNSASLTVNPPIPQKQLGKYRAVKGVYVIRLGDTVLYIGTSSNIYKTIMRLSQKGGLLSDHDRNRLSFETIITSFRTPSVEGVLKRHFLPLLNRKPSELVKFTAAQNKQCERILEAYLAQTRFEVKGEHQTDSKTK